MYALYMRTCVVSESHLCYMDLSWGLKKLCKHNPPNSHFHLPYQLVYVCHYKMLQPNKIINNRLCVCKYVRKYVQLILMRMQITIC